MSASLLRLLIIGAVLFVTSIFLLTSCGCCDCCNDRCPNKCNPVATVPED